jgi:hypothetical protein
VKTYTDPPFLITLTENAEHGGLVSGKFLTEADLAMSPESAEGRSSTSSEHNSPPEAAWKTVLLDVGTGKPVVPNGSMGFRYADSGVGRFCPQFNVNPLDLTDQAAAAVSGRRSSGCGRLCRQRAGGRNDQNGSRGPRRAGELATHTDAVALQSFRFIRQRQRVLPEVPPRYPRALLFTLFGMRRKAPTT